MLKLEVNENQFSLYFKNYHLFKHSPELPLISIGYGQNSFKEKHSVYKFKDQVIKKADLINFEVKENTDSKIKIHLSSENGKVKLELNISIEEENLKLTPEILEKDGPEPINRFWFQMNADPEEAVYGCGE